jgi:hypothetical protein
MGVLEPREVAAAAAAGNGELPGRVFAVLADLLGERSGDVVVFAGADHSFRPWLTWEAVAAFHRAGWSAKPHPAYGAVGVIGSRELADVLVYDGESGERVLLELATIHDWTANKWIDQLDGGTSRLGRPLTPGITPLQVVVTVSVGSRIAVNPTWQQWLAMSAIWKRPTELDRSMPLAGSGELRVRAWVVR